MSRKEVIFRLAAVFVLAGCNSVGCVPTILKPRVADSTEPSAKRGEPGDPAEDRDYALSELEEGLRLFEQGDYVEADGRFRNACGTVEQIRGDEAREAKAIVWKESSKTFKGQPYERAAAFLYRGLCHYMMADYEGALAAFRHSLACDQETRTKEQARSEDFTISRFMAAMCYARLGEPDNAEAALHMARLHRPGNPFLKPASLERNFVAVVAVGSGPYPKPSKYDASIKAVDCAPCPEGRCEVRVGGKLVGETAETTDLFEQARSQGWGQMDTVRVSKRGLREALTHIPYVGVLSSLVRSEADLRCWRGLPRKYLLLAAEVPAGTHAVALRFLDDTGRHLSAYDQTFSGVTVRGKGGLYYFRRGRSSYAARELAEGRSGEATEHGRGLHGQETRIRPKTNSEKE